MFLRDRLELQDDRQSLSFVNRELPVPPFNHSVSAGVLRLQTASLLLTYAAAAKPPPPPAVPDNFCTGIALHSPLCTRFPKHGTNNDTTCVEFRSVSAPNGLAGKTAASCCAACLAAADCAVWVHDGTYSGEYERHKIHQFATVVLPIF